MNPVARSGSIAACARHPSVADLARFRTIEGAALLHLGMILPGVDHGRQHVRYQHPDSCNDEHAQDDHSGGHNLIVPAMARPAIHQVCHHGQRQ